MKAAWEGKTEVVVELVKSGANVDMQNEVCQYIYVVQAVHTCSFVLHVCMYICLLFPSNQSFYRLISGY